MSLLVVGSVAFDNVETPMGKQTDILGGSATYFSVAASHFSPVRIVAVVGDDFPNEHRLMLGSRRIDTTGLQVAQGKTFRWSGKYDGDMNEAITLDTQLNVFEGFRPELPESYLDSKYLFLGNIDPDLQMKVLEQLPNARLVALDTMNFWISGKREALVKTLQHIYLLVINDAEIRQLSGVTRLWDAVDAVVAMGPKIIVVKRGEYGSVLYYKGSWFCLPTDPSTRVLDPTGAGDSFAGGMMGYIAGQDSVNYQTLKQAVAFGTVVASFNIQSFGPWRLTEITHEQIQEQYRNLENLVDF